MQQLDLPLSLGPIVFRFNLQVVCRQSGRWRLLHVHVAEHLNSSIVKPPGGVAREHGILVSQFHMANQPLGLCDCGIAQNLVSGEDLDGLGNPLTMLSIEMTNPNLCLSRRSLLERPVEIGFRDEVATKQIGIQFLRKVPAPAELKCAWS